MAEQKLGGTEAEQQRLAKHENTTSAAFRLTAGTWRYQRGGSPLWSLLRWRRSQARVGEAPWDPEQLERRCDLLANSPSP